MEEKYINYIRNLWALPFVYPWQTGPVNKTHRFFPWRWQMVLSTLNRDKGGWHYYRKNLEEVGKKMATYFKKPANLKKYEALFKKFGDQTTATANKSLKVNLKLIPLNDLGELYKKWNGLFENFAAISICLDATDEVLQKIFEKQLKKAKINLPVQDISLLLTPDKPSYARKADKDLHNLAIRYIQTKTADTKEILLKQYLNKWWWKDLGWGQFSPLTKVGLVKELSIYRHAKNVQKLERTEKIKETKLSHQKQKIKKFLSANLKNFLKVYEKLAELHDLRKEVQMRMMYALLLLSKEILKRASMPYSDIFFLTPAEIIGFTRGAKVNPKVLKDRKTAYWCEATLKGVTILQGKAALKKIEHSAIYKPRAWDSSLFFQGIPASAGKVVGRARVGLKSKEIIKTMKKGEILVTGQTSPDFVSAMKKASAIVTDEGGITSHAAIVSRELGIPCVIGTKIATRVLKTGDMVEVNANHGWVRKIK